MTVDDKKLKELYDEYLEEVKQLDIENDVNNTDLFISKRGNTEWIIWAISSIIEKNFEQIIKQDEKGN